MPRKYTRGKSLAAGFKDKSMSLDSGMMPQLQANTINTPEQLRSNEYDKKAVASNIHITEQEEEEEEDNSDKKVMIKAI